MRQGRQTIIPFAACLAMLLSIPLIVSCAQPGKRTAIGAGTGAATGAVIGGVSKGKKGAGVGAAIGAAAGAAVGNYLDKQAQELEKVEAAQVERTKEGLMVNLKNDLLFETGSAVLKEDAIQSLSQLGDILAKYEEDRIRIEGHTDSTGGRRQNEILSMRRAEAVKNILMGRGVDQKRMMIIGKGEQDPVASNRTQEGRSENRRVELHIDVPQS